jgi:hypothetical protein
MGVEYYLVNTKDKIFYDLGKGGWYDLNYDMEAFFDLEYLIEEILTECYDGDESKRDYVANRVAPDLYNICKGCTKSDIFIVHDCGDDLTFMRTKNYKCVGARYYDKDSEEYNKHMDFLNRHLEDTLLNKRRYDPKSLERYPGFEKY